MRNKSTVHSPQSTNILAYRWAKKPLAAFVAGVFLFTGTFGYAGDSLSPSLRSRMAGFQEKFLAGEVLLSHKRVNEYIENAFAGGAAKRDGETIGIGSSKFYRAGQLEFNEAEVVSVPGLLAKARQPAHVGLGRAAGRPTIYLDGGLYYDEDLRRHEVDEVVQWELLRGKLNLRPHQMRQWILDHFDLPDEDLKGTEYERSAPELTSAAIARKFHERSHRFPKRLYKEGAKEMDFATMLALYDEAEEEKDVNIASHEAGPSKEAVFESLLDFYKSKDDPSRRAGVIRYLGQADPDVVAEAIVDVLNFMGRLYMDRLSRFSEAGLERDGVQDAADTLSQSPNIHVTVNYHYQYLDYTENYQRDLASLFDAWFHITSSEELSNFRIFVKEQQTIFLRLLPELGEGFMSAFLLNREEKYYLANTAGVSVRTPAEEWDDNMVNLIRPDHARWMETIDKSAADPMVGYGSCGHYFLGALMELEDPDHLLVADRAPSQLVNMFLRRPGGRMPMMILGRLIGFLIRAGDPRGESSADGASFQELGLDRETGERFVSELERLIDTSEDPFLVRDALTSYFYVREVPEDRKYERLLKVIERAASSTDDIRRRCWFAARILPILSYPVLTRRMQGLHYRLGRFTERILYETGDEAIAHLQGEGPRLTDTEYAIFNTIAHPAVKGPALFVDKDGTVRELDQAEHDLLNTALRGLVFGPSPIAPLDETAARRLIGEELYASMQRTGPPVSAYVIDDDELTVLLPYEYIYLAEGLITHAGTFKGRAHNLFIPRSIYETLLKPEHAGDLENWRKHEVGHLLHRDADITPDAAEADSARRILEERVVKNTLDMRPIKSGLMGGRFVGLAMATKELLNPDNRPIRVLSGASGSDVSDLFLSTNAAVTVLVDSLNFEPYRRGKGYNFDIHDRYLEHKRRRGFIYGSHMSKTPVLNGIIGELSMMGVAGEEIEEIKDDWARICNGDHSTKRLSREGMDSGRFAYRIRFDWAYPGEDPKEREVIYIQENMEYIRDSMPAIRRMAGGGLDGYYQRAAQNLPKSYNRYIGDVASAITANGFIATDDHDNDGMDHSVLKMAAIRYMGFRSRPPSAEMKRWAGLVRTSAGAYADGYGWEISIALKTDDAEPGKVPVFTRTDRGHMADLVEAAGKKIERGELDARLPVVARIVAGDGRVIATAARKTLDRPTKYGVKAVHAEIAAIREAEAAGFSDWRNATLYVNIDSCYMCSRAITEFYHFKRVVYGVEDPTTADHNRNRDGYGDNGVELTGCDDPEIRGRIYAMFEEAFRGGVRDIALHEHIVLHEKRVIKHFREEFDLLVRRLDQEGQVAVFDADLWARNRGNTEAEGMLLRHLEWFKQDLNPAKGHLVVLTGTEENCAAAKERLIGDGLFDDLAIVMGGASAPSERLAASGEADEDANGSPAGLLNRISRSDELMKMALNKDDGLEAAYAARAGAYHAGTTRSEFYILRDIGVFVPVKGKRGYYRFSDMMIGYDEKGNIDPNYTRTMINAVKDIRYQVAKRGTDRPLYRGDIPEDKRPVVRELVRMTVINQARDKFMPAVEENKTLWHVIESDVIPVDQRASIVTALNKWSRESDLREKIRILNDGERLTDVIADIRKDPNAVVDVALSDESHTDQLPDDKAIKMLVFRSGSNFIQLEGVLDALRALHNTDRQAVINDLLRIYSRMAGESYRGDIPPPDLLDDPRDFARRFIFNLPPATAVPADDIPKMNERLLQLLRAA